MCLNINTRHHPRLKHLIANRDIYTLKVSLYNNKLRKPVSYYRNVYQKYNEVLNSNLIFNNFYNNNKITKGLHSLISGFTGVLYGDDFDSTRDTIIIILCRIPKGSEYYIGKENDIVSNKLVLIQPIVVNNQYPIKNNNILNIPRLNTSLWNRCIKHCEEAGYKIGL